MNKNNGYELFGKEGKLSLKEFGKLIKKKYNAYQSFDDEDLAKKIIAKNPEFQSFILEDDLKKKENSSGGAVQDLSNGYGISGEDNNPFRSKIPETELPNEESPLTQQPAEKPLPQQQALTEPQTTAQNSDNNGSFLDELNDRLLSGVANLDADIFRLPETLYNFAAIPVNFVAKELGSDQRATAEGLEKSLNIHNTPAEYYENQAKLYEEAANKINPKVQEGIVKPLMNGDYATAGRNLAATIVETSPEILAMMASGAGAGQAATAIAGTLMFGADKAREIKQSGKKTDPLKAQWVAFSDGAITSMFTSVFGASAMGSGFKAILEKEGGEAAKKYIARTLMDKVGKMMVENPALAPFAQGFDLASMKFAQNVVDKYSGYKPKLNLSDGLYDSWVTGLAMGSAFGGWAKFNKIADDIKAGRAVKDEINKSVIRDKNGNVVGFKINGNEIHLNNTAPAGDGENLSGLNPFKPNETKNVDEWVNERAREDGNVAGVKTEKGIFYALDGELKDGKITSKTGKVKVLDPDGNESEINVKDIQDVFVEPKGVVAEKLKEKEKQQSFGGDENGGTGTNGVQIGDEFDYNGNPAKVTGMLSNGDAVIAYKSETDGSLVTDTLPTETISLLKKQKSSKNGSRDESKGENVPGNVKSESGKKNNDNEGKPSVKEDDSNSNELEPQPKGKGEESNPPATKETKKPWEMTSDEYANDVYHSAEAFGDWGGLEKHVKIVGVHPNGNEFELGVKPTPTKAKKYAKALHKQLVQHAIENGENVPDNVLKEYPDLQKLKNDNKNKPVASYNVKQKVDRFLGGSVKGANEDWDNEWSEVEAQLNKVDEKIRPLKEKLKEFKGRLTKERKQEKQNIQKQIDALNEEKEKINIQHEDNQWAFAEELKNRVKQIGKERGLDISDDDAGEMANFISNEIFERPGIEANWEKNVKDVIEEAIKDHEEYNKGKENPKHPQSPKEQRAAGYKVENGVKIERQSPITNKVLGKPVEWDFSNDVKGKGNLTVIESDELQPSHLNQKRNPKHFIPEAQPKERTDKGSNAASDIIAKQLEPEKITSNTTNVYSGAPTVNERGEVIQGNNRAEALKKYWQSYKDDPRKYKQYLIEHAEEMGLDPEKVKAMKSPVLVNMIEATDEKAIKLGQYKASDLETGGVQRIEPKETARKLGAKIDSLVKILTKNESPDDLSIRELIRNNAVAALKYMRETKVINETQYQSAFKNGKEIKKEAVEDLLGVVTHSVFKDGRADMDALFEMLPARVQNAIIKNAHLINGEKGIIPEIQKAIIAYSEYKSTSDYYEKHDVKVWSLQTDMFKGGQKPVDEYGENVMNLVNIFDKAKTEKELNLKFKEFHKLAHGEDGLFPVEPIPKEQAFNEVFNKNNIYDGKTKQGNSGKGDKTIENQHDQTPDGRGNRKPTERKPTAEERGSDKGSEEKASSGERNVNQDEEPKGEKSNYGSKNRVVSKQRYEELRERLKNKLNNLNIGFDPELLSIGLEMAAYHVEAGARSFKDFASRLIGDVGDAVRPYLKAFYNGAREMPGMEEYADKMDSWETVSKIDVNSIKPYEDLQSEEKNDNFETSKVKENEQPKNSSNESGSNSNSGEKSGASDDKAGMDEGKPSVSPVKQQRENAAGELSPDNQNSPNSPKESSGGGVQTRPSQGDTSGHSGTSGHGSPGQPAESKREENRGDNSEPVQVKNQNNYKIKPDEEIIPSGEISKIKSNISAIKIAKELAESGKKATPEQQAKLVKYTGWGGLANVFANKWYSEDWKKKYQAYYNELSKFLTPDELNSAMESTINAFYTEKGIITKMWDMAKALGFKGGRVFEPAAGIGHFFGLMPESLSEKSTLYANELDNISGLILKGLYPDAHIQISGFEDTKVPNNSQTLVITNVPFGNYKVFDKNNKDIADKFNLHNYFIAKSIRKLKPGGIGIFITTSATMDNPGQGLSFRKWVTQSDGGNADFIDMVRLPNNAFKKNASTEVTTDIVIIRKRDSEKPYPKAIKAELVKSIRTAKSSEGKPIDIEVNEYYADHPEKMLGEMKLAHEAGSGGLYGKDNQTLAPSPNIDMEKSLTEFVNSLPKDILNKKITENDNEETPDVERLGKVGALIVKDGKIYQQGLNNLEPAPFNDNKVSAKKGSKKYSKSFVVEKYNEVKDVVKRLLDAEMDKSATDEQIEKIREELNKKYNDFFNLFGSISNNNKLRWLKHDVDFSFTSAIEIEEPYIDYSKGIAKPAVRVEKSDIFEKRINKPYEEPDKAQSIEDAIIISQAIKNSLDLDYIGKLIGKKPEEVKTELLEKELAFINPYTGLIEDRESYLSGFVRKKLKYAEEQEKATGNRGLYQKNIEALKKVIPEDIPLHEITAQLGAPWIPIKYIKEWAESYLADGDEGITISYEPLTDKWKVFGSWTIQRSSKVNRVYSVKKLNGLDLLSHALNQTSPIVYEKAPDGKTRVKDEESTNAAQSIIDEMRYNFRNWVLNLDEKHGAELVRKYNDEKNGLVLRKYEVPEKYHFPNANPKITLEKHQARGVIRVLHQSVLLAWQVGTGKTYTLITTAMEMKRLKLANKPLLVVQKATMPQIIQSFRDLYPNANILAPDSKEVSKANRIKLFSKIAMNDWDAIIITHDFLSMIPDKPERQAAYIRERIDEMENVLDNMDDDEGGFKKRELEKEIEALQKSLDEIFEADKKQREEYNLPVKQKALGAKRIERSLKNQFNRKIDDVFYFEDMGIDALLIDEAHTFKRLGFSTKAGNIKGIDRAGAKKSLSAKLKIQYILDQKDKKNVVFATGTPISNTLAESWTMMKYLAPDKLKEYGIYDFDAFKAVFGSIEKSLEFTPSGDFKVVDRFAGYQNLPELQKLWLSIADVVLTNEIHKLKAGIGTPKLQDGKFTQVYIEPTKEVNDLKEVFRQRLIAWHNLSGKEKKLLRHVPLVTFNEATRAAIDPRLVNSNLPFNKGYKSAVAADNVFKIWKETSDYKGTQLIFSDAKNSRDGKFNLFEDIKRDLVGKGIPAQEIAIIDDYNSDKKREKLFEKVNAGVVRVVLGGTEKLGVGVNVQERLKAVHHLDAPARPMDFEQRNGRMIRRGNIHLDMDKPVAVYMYGVKKTIDAAAYQLLAVKGNFIKPMLSNKLIRERSLIDDTEEDMQNMSFSEMMANMSGSKYVKIKLVKEQKLRRLELERATHYKKVQEGKREIEEKKYSSDRLTKRIEHGRETESKLNEIFSEKEIKSIKVNNEPVVSEKFGKEIDRVFEDFKNNTANFLTDKKFVVTINGKFRLIIEPAISTKVKTNGSMEMFSDNSVQKGMKWYLDPELDKGNYFDATTQFYTTGSGVLNSFLKKAKELGESLNNSSQMLSTLQKNIGILQEMVSKPWGKEEEYEGLKAEIKDLEKKMQEEMAAESNNGEANNDPTDEPITNSTIEENENNNDNDVSFRSVSREDFESNPAGYQEEVQKEMDKIGEELGVNIHVVRDFADLPEHIQKEAVKRGVFITGAVDKNTGELYVISNNVPTVEEARKTAFHESVGHKGMLLSLGEDYGKVMDEIYAGMSREKIKEISEQEKTTNPHIIAEEYAARMAEDMRGPSLLSRVIFKIRNLIRKVWKLHYNGLDIINLLKQSRDALRNSKSEEAKKYGEVSFRTKDKETDALFELEPLYKSLEKSRFSELDLAQVNSGLELSELHDQMKAAYKELKKANIKGVTSYKDVSEIINTYLNLKVNPEAPDMVWGDLSKETQRRVKQAREIMTPQMKKIADYIANQYDIVGQYAIDNGIILKKLDNYVARIYDFKDNRIPSEFHRKFGTTTRHSKKRVFESVFEAEAAGYKLKVKDAALNLAILKNEIANVVENKKLIERGLRIRDEEGHPVFTVKPNLEGYSKIKNPGFKKWMFVYKLKHIPTEEEIQEFMEHPDKPLPDGMPLTSFGDGEVYINNKGEIYKRKAIYAPDKIAKRLNNILSSSAALNEVPVIKELTNFNNLSKELLLSYSFYHHFNFIRAFLFGSKFKNGVTYNPFKAYKLGLQMAHDKNPLFVMLVKNGLTAFRIQDWDEDLFRKNLRLFNKLHEYKVPSSILNSFMAGHEKHTSFLFEKLGAGLKIYTGILRLEDLMKKYPNANPNDLAAMAAEFSNNLYGGIHLERKARNKILQHMIRLVNLAPDWNEGNIRLMTGALKKGIEGDMYREFWGKAFLRIGALTFLANALMAIFNDPDDKESYLQTLMRMYKTAFKHPLRLNWLAVDITPVHNALPHKEEKNKYEYYLNAAGQFQEPSKYAGDFFQTLKNKSSVIVKIWLDLASGENWRGQRYTTTPELLGTDDKGVYLKSYPGKGIRVGDPKGGRLKGRLNKWSNDETGAVKTSELPSFILSELRGIMPIPVDNITSWGMGDLDGYNAVFHGIGLNTSKAKSLPDYNEENYTGLKKDVTLYFAKIKDSQKHKEKEKVQQYISNNHFPELVKIKKIITQVDKLKRKYNAAIVANNPNVANNIQKEMAKLKLKAIRLYNKIH